MCCFKHMWPSMCMCHVVWLQCQLIQSTWPQKHIHQHKVIKKRYMCAFIITKYYMGAMCVDLNQIPMDGGASNQRLHLLCSMFAYAFHFFKFLLDFKCQCRISVEIFFWSQKLQVTHGTHVKRQIQPHEQTSQQCGPVVVTCLPYVPCNLPSAFFLATVSWFS